MKIAIAGKGGVGKTLIAGGIALSLARAGYTTIAIDADPTPNLALSLGISLADANAIQPVSENAGLIRMKTGTGYPGVYALNFSVTDIVADYAVPTPSGVNLLVMGSVRSMDDGCSCAANSVVRALVRHLVVERDEAVVLDMEAGLEHIGRGTAAGVDCMAVVTDANVKSLDTAGKIARMAREFGISGIIMIANRIRTPAEESIITAFAAGHDLPVAGFIPYDPMVVEAGISGRPLTSLAGSPALKEIERIGQSIMAGRSAGKKDQGTRNRGTIP